MVQQHTCYFQRNVHLVRKSSHCRELAYDSCVQALWGWLCIPLIPSVDCDFIFLMVDFQSGKEKLWSKSWKRSESYSWNLALPPILVFLIKRILVALSRSLNLYICQRLVGAFVKWLWQWPQRALTWKKKNVLRKLVKVLKNVSKVCPLKCYLRVMLIAQSFKSKEKRQNMHR